MDFRLLRYFVACVESRTMHAAARAVNVSQPALSKAIGNLELELGVQLLDRQPRGVTPTPYGQTLFRYAKMMDSEMRRAVAEIDAMRGMTRGTIVVGVIPTMAEVMGEVALKVMSSHPGLRLKLRVGFSSELRAALLDGEIDFALLLLPSDTEQPGMRFEALLNTGPVVVVRKGHPVLNSGMRPGPEELAAYPWLIPDYPPSHRQIISKAFLDAGLPPPSSAIEVSTIIFFDNLIRTSDLVTVVPETLLSARETEVGLVALETAFDFPPESVGLAFRENSTLLPGARVLVDLIRGICADIREAGGGQRRER